MIYLVRNEQLNENCHIKVPVGNLLGLACTQNCLALAWTFGSTVQHRMIQVSLFRAL